MFDFKTTDAPLAITIDGKRYELPRFLLPRFKAHAAEKRQKQIDEALEQIEDAQQRARFMLYYDAPPIDVADTLRWLTTPEGIETVITDCFDRGGVPADIRDKVLSTSDPAILRTLADELSQAARAGQVADTLTGGAKDGDESDPLAKRADT